MSRKLQLTTAARQDLRSARRWYLDEAPHMDLPFRSSVREALERIRENPRQYPEVHRGLRRALTHRFPFSIFYRFTGEDILVIAVVHGARHPDTWRRRS